VSEKLTRKEFWLLVLLGVCLVLAIIIEVPPEPGVVARERVEAGVLSVGQEQIVVAYEGITLRLPTTETNLALVGDGSTTVCLLTLEDGEKKLRPDC